jgi:hypothetical protein
VSTMDMIVMAVAPPAVPPTILPSRCDEYASGYGWIQPHPQSFCRLNQNE